MTTSTAATAPAANAPAAKSVPHWATLLAVVAAIVILMLPPQAGLSVAGQRMLAVLAFAVVVWMAESMDYAVSSVVIVAMMAFLLGTSPSPKDPAVWLGTVNGLQMESMSPLGVFAALSAFLVVIHLGFASATSLAAAMIPIMIAVLQRLGGDINVGGMTMLLAFVVSFGFILPVNAPQNMVCFGTETFTSKQFTKFGLLITVAGFAMLMIFAVTWWDYLGLLTIRR